MKKIRTLSRSIAVLFLCLTFCVLPQTALAYEEIDTSRENSLTLIYQNDTKCISGAAFQLYRVADVSPSAQFTLAGSFAGYSVQLTGLDSAGWKALAETLAAYAARDQIQPQKNGTTNGSGKLTWSGLPSGLYLVTGSRHSQNGYIYTPEPFLICLPTLTDRDTWQYDTAVSIKYDRTPDGGGSDDDDHDIQRSVIKVWKNDEKDSRPESVEVQLLRDGDIYDTVTLSAANNWSHHWTSLGSGHRWQVIEKAVPDGYTVTVSQEGSTFVVTNSWPDDPDDPDDPPDGPDDPDDPPDDPDDPDDPPNVPDDPNNPPDDPPDTPDDPGTPDIPQTGQLWWPVPILAGCGMLLFLLGWKISRKQETRDEE